MFSRRNSFFNTNVSREISCQGDVTPGTEVVLNLLNECIAVGGGPQPEVEDPESVLEDMLEICASEPPTPSAGPRIIADEILSRPVVLLPGALVTPPVAITTGPSRRGKASRGTRSGRVAKARREWRRLQRRQSELARCYNAWFTANSLPGLQPAYSGCWNCTGGHFYSKCVLPLRIFCFRCGIRNITVRDCPKCKVGWRRQGAWLEDLGRHVPWHQNLPGPTGWRQWN